MEFVSIAQSPVIVRSADSSILLKLSANSGCHPEGDKTNENPTSTDPFLKHAINTGTQEMKP